MMTSHLSDCIQKSINNCDDWLNRVKTKLKISRKLNLFICPLPSLKEFKVGAFTSCSTAGGGGGGGGGGGCCHNETRHLSIATCGSRTPHRGDNLWLDANCTNPLGHGRPSNSNISITLPGRVNCGGFFLMLSWEDQPNLSQLAKLFHADNLL